MSDPMSAIAVTPRNVDGVLGAPLNYVAQPDGLSYPASIVVDPALVTPDAVTAAGGAAGLVEVGTHSWKVTFVHPQGESLPSAKSNVVTIATSAKHVALSAIPLGPASCTARNIYRTIAGDTGAWKLV